MPASKPIASTLITAPDSANDPLKQMSLPGSLMSRSGCAYAADKTIDRSTEILGLSPHGRSGCLDLPGRHTGFVRCGIHRRDVQRDIGRTSRCLLNIAGDFLGRGTLFLDR